MATYKVIQDIEAEDHILGPLTLRQFIYGLVTAFFLYLCFIVITKHAAFLLVIFLPPALFSGFFAFPFGKDQPTEVWALAKLRFLFKPRRRIWNQSGVKELVTITVPKRVEVQLTNGLNQTEVKSRLEALASTIDSRGWAIKNAGYGGGGYVQPSVMAADASSDRLINIGSMPRPVPDFDITGRDDILDDQASPLAQQFTQMIDTSTKSHRQQLMDELNEVRAASAQASTPQWFASSPLGTAGGATRPAIDTSTGMTPATNPTAAETALLAHSQQQQAAASQANAHLRTLRPIDPNAPVPTSQPVVAKPATTPAASGSAPTDPAILKLATNNDLNISTLAHEAGKTKELDGSNGEVVISLH